MISRIIKFEVRVISAESKAEADNTYRDPDLFLGYLTKTEFNNCFITHCFEENNQKHTAARNLNIDIVIGNHAMRAQTTKLEQITDLTIGCTDFQN